MKSFLPPLLLGSAMIVCLLVVDGNISAATYNEPNNKRPAAQLYSKYCIECHGTDGRSQTKKGKHSHARDLSDAKWQDDTSDERIFNSIMNGRNVRGNMPGFNKKITDEEADALVTYVRQLKK
jgi:mono/diheme cytochrome c family protein